MKKNLLLVFYLLAGIIAGSLLASVAAGVPFLSWLAYSASVGFAANDPACLDLIVVKLHFGFSMAVSVAQILCISLALFIYNRSHLR